MFVSDCSVPGCVLAWAPIRSVEEAGPVEVEKEVARELQSFVGPKATSIIQSMMSAQIKGGSVMAIALGGIALVFGATGVFMQLLG
jgi:hypothetical protein